MPQCLNCKGTGKAGYFKAFIQFVIAIACVVFCSFIIPSAKVIGGVMFVGSFILLAILCLAGNHLIGLGTGFSGNLEMGKDAKMPILFCKIFYILTHYLLDKKDDVRYICPVIPAGFPPIQRRTA